MRNSRFLRKTTAMMIVVGSSFSAGDGVRGGTGKLLRAVMVSVVRDPTVESSMEADQGETRMRVNCLVKGSIMRQEESRAGSTVQRRSSTENLKVLNKILLVAIGMMLYRVSRTGARTI